MEADEKKNALSIETQASQIKRVFKQQSSDETEVGDIQEALKKDAGSITKLDHWQNRDDTSISRNQKIIDSLRKEESTLSTN